jgi:hypothetical protein
VTTASGLNTSGKTNQNPGPKLKTASRAAPRDMIAKGLALIFVAPLREIFPRDLRASDPFPCYNAPGQGG